VVIKQVESHHEPWEYFTIDVPEHHTGKATAMAQRRALLKNMHNTKSGVRLSMKSTANLIGYRSEPLSAVL
jgi:predicted membrane GTPase involved in stress response